MPLHRNSQLLQANITLSVNKDFCYSSTPIFYSRPIFAKICLKKCSTSYFDLASHDHSPYRFRRLQILSSNTNSYQGVHAVKESYELWRLRTVVWVVQSQWLHCPLPLLEENENAQYEQAKVASLADHLEDTDGRYEAQSYRPSPIVYEQDEKTKSEEKVIVAVKQGNLLATTFHLELTADTRWHNYFLKMVNAEEQHQSVFIYEDNQPPRIDLPFY